MAAFLDRLDDALTLRPGAAAEREDGAHLHGIGRRGAADGKGERCCYCCGQRRPSARERDAMRNELSKQATNAGMGVALISFGTIAAEVRGGLLGVLDVEGLSEIRRSFAVRRVAKWPQPVAQAIWDHCRAGSGVPPAAEAKHERATPASGGADAAGRRPLFPGQESPHL